MHACIYDAIYVKKSHVYMGASMYVCMQVWPVVHSELESQGVKGVSVQEAHKMQQQVCARACVRVCVCALAHTQLHRVPSPNIVPLLNREPLHRVPLYRVSLLNRVPLLSRAPLLHTQGWTIVDVRVETHYNYEHCEGAVSLPLYRPVQVGRTILVLFHQYTLLGSA